MEIYIYFYCKEKSILIIRFLIKQPKYIFLYGLNEKYNYKFKTLKNYINRL